MSQLQIYFWTRRAQLIDERVAWALHNGSRQDEWTLRWWATNWVDSTS